MDFKKQKFLSIFFSFLLFCNLAVFLPIPVSAAGLVPCGGNTASATDTGKPCTFEDLFVLVARVTNWLIGVAGAYAVYQIVFAGFNLVTSMGNEEKITKNKDALSNAIVGFVFTLLAFVLVNTAVNFILLSGNKDRRVDLTNPLCYLYADPQKCSTSK